MNARPAGLAPELPTLPGYEIRRLLARGGMAAVYEAVQLSTGRVVALKRMLPEVADDPEFLERFSHEARIHSALHHPNVLALYDWGVGAESYLAMELGERGTLRMLLDRVPRVPPELALWISAQLARGLAAAHEKGIVHRDMKPQNVLITADGTLKVADFGIAKAAQMTRLTTTGSTVGTPAYMSPEQAMAKPLDGRSDVFSLGTLLYEMLTGHNPFLTDNPATTLRMVVDDEPRPLFSLDPTLPIECELVVEKLLRKAPEARFASAAEAAAALEERALALGLALPNEAFRRLLDEPDRLLADRADRLSRLHAHRARSLDAASASPEAILWEAYLATSYDPRNEDASRLLSEHRQRTGYRVETGPARPRIAELEERLRDEPDNVALLLQTAKAARMDRDFLRLMRHFFRLRALPIDDPYLAGQAASLVARPSGTSASLAGAPAGGSRPGSPSVEGRRTAAGRPPAAPVRETAPTRRLPSSPEKGTRPGLSKLVAAAIVLTAGLVTLFLLLR